MDTTKFDVMLDASDPDFAEQLIAALGLQEGETLNIMTPQFKRTDGRTVHYIPTTVREFDAIKLLDAEQLKKIGMQQWDEESGLWLYPFEWYDHIPHGYNMMCISGEMEKYIKGETDDDHRFGALAYGFIKNKDAGGYFTALT